MTYYEELTDRIMEAEKPHGLPPASWRPRRASDIVLRDGGQMKEVPVEVRRQYPSTSGQTKRLTSKLYDKLGYLKCIFITNSM